ncbi:MAG: DNA polymerase III subunit gamma/tau [Nitrospinae bacterium]|nr:DNA polymerase III subunit gamma/tau [Nitrospinota bacterium]
MSYQVLARTWRPQKFEDVVGQDHVTQTLKNAITDSRVAHAYCFSGARGVGKTTTARILAKALNCREGPTPTPCDSCENCKEIRAGTSPDVVEIDGATYRRIENVRELQEKLQYIPAKSPCKVYIIDEVHMFTKEAFNALLKTLEEPPSHVHFVFATTEPHKIPETVLSRCQRFDFRQLSPTEIAAHIKRVCAKEDFTIPDEGVALIARAAEGSIRDALGLLDQLVALAGKTVEAGDVAVLLGRADQVLLARVVEAVRTGGAAKLLEVVADLVAHGQDLRVFCRDLLEYIRHLLVCRSVKEPAGLVPYSEAVVAEVQAQAHQFSAESLHRLFEGLHQAELAVRGADAPQWVLEAALLRLASLEPVTPMEDILSKLAVLEEATRSSQGVSGTEAPREPTLFEMEGSVAEAVVETPEVVSEPTDLDASPTLPAPSVRTPPDTLEGLWERLIIAVEQRAFRVAQLLKEGHPVSLDQRNLAVSFVAPFCATYFEEDEHRRLVEEEAGRLAGRSLRLQVVRADDQASPPSPDLHKAAPGTGSPAPPGHPGEDHHDGMVQEAMETLGGTIIEEGILPATED